MTVKKIKRNLPSEYTQSLPRVSQIVEYFYPFTGENRERFITWLMSKDIELDEYMKEASEGGRYVHSALETFMKSGEFNGKKYKNIINGGIQFLTDYKVIPLLIEEYIKTKDYQGTIDLIATIDGVKWVLDWKSYGLAKDKFKIPQPTEYRKPYDKLKKARLQLSLYARSKRINNIGIIELTQSGYHFHKLVPYSKEELNTFIKEFNLNYIDEI